jgi:hypothetical protein
MFKNVDINACIDINLTLPIFIDQKHVSLNLAEDADLPKIDINTIDPNSQRYESHLISYEDMNTVQF